MKKRGGRRRGGSIVDGPPFFFFFFFLLFLIYYKKKKKKKSLSFSDRMTTKGVWQLAGLRLRYCDWGGSSSGMREFLSGHGPALRRERFSFAEWSADMVRNKHPIVFARY